MLRLGASVRLHYRHVLSQWLPFVDDPNGRLRMFVGSGCTERRVAKEEEARHVDAVVFHSPLRPFSSAHTLRAQTTQGDEQRGA